MRRLENEKRPMPYPVTGFFLCVNDPVGRRLGQEEEVYLSQVSALTGFLSLLIGCKINAIRSSTGPSVKASGRERSIGAEQGSHKVWFPPCLDTIWTPCRHQAWSMRAVYGQAFHHVRSGGNEDLT